MAFSVIFVLLFGSFIIIFIVARYSENVASQFPIVDCETIETDYGANLQEYAVDDYNYI